MSAIFEFVCCILGFGTRDVGKEFTNQVDLERPNWIASDHFPAVFYALRSPPSYRDAVINATVYRGGRSKAITPRHHLDFINQFVNLYHEKRSDIEEQQLHLTVGLNKIAETVEQVEEMQKSLAVKSQELQTKNEAANSKLRQMVKDQNEAEQKKIQSQEIQAMIKQTYNIAIKKKDVMADLDQVEPAVTEAQIAVKGINKQHLVELKSLNNSPATGEVTSDWKTIRPIIVRENFISTIVNFCTEDISDNVHDQMINKYLNNSDYNFDKVNRASEACGPLVKWATAQVNHADILKRVELLRNELKSLDFLLFFIKGVS
ncbi:hypothetical protein DAPPUDRAFT_244076 [Daphnia pulex]|uniref:Dynein heavy chain coiled coil stalk domain-containing protein n=1 Tax=Daphnia pulex TaxID=6669 RepID=E9GK75_DAPPU|nr:hypothetical protein DAPPUDRAFT_244076 [Daphnia pulex]|eukprot:EFX79940.1 hypothetical protein DAPPUDRAFT_244076 [Daphnia pulex]